MDTPYVAELVVDLVVLAGLVYMFISMGKLKARLMAWHEETEKPLANSEKFLELAKKIYEESRGTRQIVDTFVGTVTKFLRSKK